MAHGAELGSDVAYFLQELRQNLDGFFWHECCPFVQSGVGGVPTGGFLRPRDFAPPVFETQSLLSPSGIRQVRRAAARGDDSNPLSRPLTPFSEKERCALDRVVLENGTQDTLENGGDVFRLHQEIGDLIRGRETSLCSLHLSGIVSGNALLGRPACYDFANHASPCLFTELEIGVNLGDSQRERHQKLSTLEHDRPDGELISGIQLPSSHFLAIDEGFVGGAQITDKDLATRVLEVAMTPRNPPLFQPYLAPRERGPESCSPLL